MNISTEQTYIVMGIIYIVGVIIIALRIRWVNSQYVKPIYNVWYSIGIASLSWIILTPSLLYMFWEWFRDWIESNSDDKYNKVTNKYYETVMKYNDIVDKYIQAIELLAEVESIDPGIPSETCGDLYCFFCSAYLEIDEHDKDCTHIKIHEFLNK